MNQKYLKTKINYKKDKTQLKRKTRSEKA